MLQTLFPCPIPYTLFRRWFYHRKRTLVYPDISVHLHVPNLPAIGKKSKTTFVYPYWPIISELLFSGCVCVCACLLVLVAWFPGVIIVKRKAWLRLYFVVMLLWKETKQTDLKWNGTRLYLKFCPILLKNKIALKCSILGHFVLLKQLFIVLLFPPSEKKNLWAVVLPGVFSAFISFIACWLVLIPNLY